MTLPIARTAPSCFCHVDGTPEGCSPHRIGGAKMAVGDEAASCELKASFVSSGEYSFTTPLIERRE